MSRPLYENQKKNKILKTLLSLANSSKFKKQGVPRLLAIREAGFAQSTFDYHMKKCKKEDLVKVKTINNQSYYLPTPKAPEQSQTSSQQSPPYKVLPPKTYFTETATSIDANMQTKYLTSETHTFEMEFEDGVYPIQSETIKIYELVNDKCKNIPITKLEKINEHFVKVHFTLDKGKHDILFFCKYHHDIAFFISNTTPRQNYTILKTLKPQKSPPILEIHDPKYHTDPLKLKKIGDKTYLLDHELPVGRHVCRWNLNPL